jgi:acetyl esterase/lipase
MIMGQQLIYRLGITLASSLCILFPAIAEELSPIPPGTTILGERIIPAPVGISPEMLEVVKARQIPPASPAPKTTEEWLELQAVFDEAGEKLGREAAANKGVTYEVGKIAGVRTYIVTPKELNDRWSDSIFVHTHGGAWVFGGGDSSLREAVWFAHGLGVKVVSIDYRRPPLHPFPAAIEDTLAVWKELTKGQDAAATALFGTSAGGNIALATTLRLKELGEPLPGAIFAGTPATDLENISDTWHTLAGLDPLGVREGMLAAAFGIYIGEAAPSNPLLSPINGDLKDFPPTILISGTRDLLLSDTVRMHRALRKAGVETDLHIYDGQTHGDYMQNLLRYVPESEDAQRELFEFFNKHLD